VVTGNGHALVVLTGKDTYMASIAKDLAKKRPLNPMQIGIRNISYVLMAFMSLSRYFSLSFGIERNLTSLDSGAHRSDNSRRVEPQLEKRCLFRHLGRSRSHSR
jgi:magnesium-transporting ATPase (P-type)